MSLFLKKNKMVNIDNIKLGDSIKNYKNVRFEYRDKLIVVFISFPSIKEFDLYTIKCLISKNIKKKIKSDFSIELKKVFIHKNCIEIYYFIK